MAGEKGVRLPLTRATETQGAYTTEPNEEQHLKESRREGRALMKLKHKLNWI